MLRKIIKIDESLCNGCGLCSKACHEGAIQIINGKAKLTREDYCDGLGDCLPVCPTNAITFEIREAPAYDEKAVMQAKNVFKPSIQALPKVSNITKQSELINWPVQIQLAPITAPYFNDVHLLIAADCCAYSYENFHQEFMHDRITLIGCPKLDQVNYMNKLTQIFIHNDIKSILLTRMEVPCCGGLEFAVRTAIENSGKNITIQTVTITSKGYIK